MNPRRVAVGAVTAVLALLALTAMHALPMVMAHSDAASAAASGGAVMPVGHVDGMTMPGDVHGVDAAGAATGAASVLHSTDGVPPHEHSLLHLCVAVLVAGLSLAVAAVFRRRRWTSTALTRIAPVRAVLTRDTGPPSLTGLCLLRC